MMLDTQNKMCVSGTPVEHHPELALWVKREDLCCPGGPNFSKTRGVYAHIAKRPERFIGVLDTSHSQGGWAVARACALLGKQCVEFYPVTKHQRLHAQELGGEVQRQCRALGAHLLPLVAGRSAVLYHRAVRWMMDDHAQVEAGSGRYMMPNALKLPESVEETAAEVRRTLLPDVDTILVSASSGTIAAGVARGLLDIRWMGRLIIHQGYSRPLDPFRRYVTAAAGLEWGTPTGIERVVVDEHYTYAEAARPGVSPPFPCNEFYDLKALRWWACEGQARYGKALFWNIG